MFTQLPLPVQQELESLATQFGHPLVHLAELASADFFDPLNATDRYGEVCMVVRRTDGRLLTGKKTFYPAGAHRLLTGGINFGEKVLDALLRETWEETGLQVVVCRFLVAVAYHAPAQPEQPVFYTFAFLLDEAGGVLESQDPQENLEYFREITLDELPERAEFFSHLGDEHYPHLQGNLADWGKFRAVIHYLVWEALRQKS